MFNEALEAFEHIQSVNFSKTFCLPTTRVFNSYRSQPDPNISARIAYCYSQLGSLQQAVTWYHHGMSTTLYQGHRCYIHSG